MAGTDRLRATSGMCTHVVALTAVDEIDDQVIDLLRTAYRRGS